MLEIKTSDDLSIVQVENTQGYDGHSLRAYTYWSADMPDIQQANEDEQCFKLTLEDGSELTVKASDTLIYQGKETIARELLQNML